ncbi:MAG: tRNA (adenosine(37)-N6)-threonylcarbamoyltransferase complex transferase subunit TsaD [Actinomycetia bacterium]|nr:tRNA (adenosine(37)-N6)-threonylcarbamoyltransferase complex transferase subunit TsaD [Actinomycetes bacterium]
MLVLGIETSCDESAAALVEGGSKMLSNVVASQVDIHREYGGVVPEIAARAHVDEIVPVLGEALAGDARPDLVAVTVGPGLVGSLLVGVSVAKGLSWSWGIPMVAVNHVEAHAYAPVLEGRMPRYPFLALVVSGGHTLLAEINGVDDIEILGQTLDDALGEAYDKVARHLGLGYPGGPVIDEMSLEGDPSACEFPRPMMGSGDYNFSLSGLKTAVIRFTAAARGRGDDPPAEDVAASFQAAALEVVVHKTVRAARDRGLQDVVMGGGVACNRALRLMLGEACEEEGLELVYPSPGLCTDNAAMIAALGYLRYQAGHRAGLETDVYPNLRMGQDRHQVG